MKRKYLLILFSFLFIVSCDLNDNINPNKPLSGDLDARMRLATAEVSSYYVQGATMNELGNVFMSALAGNLYYFGNPATKEMNLAIDNSFYSGIWSGVYVPVANFQSIIEDESGLVYHKAISKILKVHYMQYIVDLYGDVPYTEAFKRTENINPKYDKSIDIYTSFVAELDEAIAMINDNPENDDIKVKTTEDVIMAGNMENWLKFANTVKLRVLLRLTESSDAGAQQLLSANIASLKDAEFVDFDVSINPGYSAASADNQNPIYNTFGLRTYSGSVNTYGWRLYKASAHIASALNGEDDAVSAGTVDPRAYELFKLYGGTEEKPVRGIIQGSLKNSQLSEWNFASPGGWLMLNAEKGSAKDGYLMLKSESEFLQAEAALEFPQFFDNAEDHFYNGVRASFDFYEIGDLAEDYLNEIDDNDGAGWSGTSNKIAAIQYQKWIALTHIHPMETYLSYMKTGYPFTPLSITAQYDHKPYRLIYPASEYSSNAANVPKMETSDAYTKNELTPLYLK